MELLLNLHNYDYKQFLNSPIDTLIIGLENFCTGYLVEYILDDIPFVIDNIHKSNKKIYISLNIISNEVTINKLITIMPFIKKLHADGFVISDFGILQIFKENALVNKVIFNPITKITNKYSAATCNNLGIDHVCIANELNLNDIIEISNYNKGNVEILAQGYYQICNSKRRLLSNFFKKFKIKTDSPFYKIKEESRDYAYPIIEINNEILIYIDKQRCVLPYFNKLIETNIQYLRIDTMFLNLEEIKQIIDIYNDVMKNPLNIETHLKMLEEKTNSNLNCLDNISILKKEK